MISVAMASPGDVPKLCELLSVLFAQEHEFSPDAEARREGLAAIMNDPDSGHFWS